MQMIEDINKILVKKGEQIGKSLINISVIKIILLEGSTVLGYGDKNSDIDLVVLVDKYPSIEIIEKRLKLFTDDIQIVESNKAWLQIQFFYENTEINIGFGRYNKFKEDVKKMTNNPHNYLLFIYQKHILNWIMNAKIIYDKENILRIKKEIKLSQKGKKNIISRYYKELERTLFSSNSSLEIELKRNNYIFLQYLISKSVEQIIEIIYILNNKLYKYPKWALRELQTFKKKPKSCENIIQQISILGNSKKEICKKITLFKLLMKYMHPLIKTYVDKIKH